jgi:Rhodanese-like domain
MKKAYLFVVLVSFLALTIGVAEPCRAGDVQRMTKNALRGILSNPDVVVLDVRTAGDWDASDLKIRGAIREDPLNVKNWMKKYPKDKTLVFYCA